MVSRVITLILCICGMAAAADQCPWLNAATAGGVLGGAVQVTTTASSCEFVRARDASEITLWIEVVSIDQPHAQCGTDAEPLKAIGNEAAACSYRGKAGWTAEQVVGRVRDRAFLVRIGTKDRSAAQPALREKARNVAEQVAGILF